MLVVASLSLGTRIVTELTVVELRGHAYGLGNVDKLLRGVATIVARSSSRIEWSWHISGKI